MIRVAVFGIGKTYEMGKKFFAENKDRVEIIAFLDNNSQVQGEIFEGVKVYAPESIIKLECDGVVILSKKFEAEMMEQLLAIGIALDDIWNFKKLRLVALRGKKTFYGSQNEMHTWSKGKVLIITTNMGFSGGIRVVVHAAMILQSKGYEVMISAPSIEEKLLDEIIKMRLKITIWDCLPYIYEADKEWICGYDVVIVNVFQMMNCAYEISKIRPVLWWIHEEKSLCDYYQNTQEEFPLINSSEWMDKLNVVGVSNIAKESFNYYYPSIISRVLPFGIPDKYDEGIIRKSGKSKIVFAVTAGFSKLKGQKILVEAVEKLSREEKMEIEIWFIGPAGKAKQELEKICDRKKIYIFWGLLSHEEVIKILPQIDVLVCPSLAETMSMSVVEGMMFKKLCITTTMTGIAEYIENGKNGFVVRAGDSDDLSGCMSWIINHKDLWDPIRFAARQTFDREFNIEKFGKRIEEELEYSKKKFYQNTFHSTFPIS